MAAGRPFHAAVRNLPGRSLQLLMPGHAFRIARQNNKRDAELPQPSGGHGGIAIGNVEVDQSRVGALALQPFQRLAVRPERAADAPALVLDDRLDQGGDHGLVFEHHDAAGLCKAGAGHGLLELGYRRLRQ